MLKLSKIIIKELSEILIMLIGLVLTVTISKSFSLKHRTFFVLN